MTLEELGTLVNNIKQAPDDVTRSEHLATLVDDYSSMLAQVTDLSSKNEELTLSNTKYAQLNQDLFLKVGLGSGTPQVTPLGVVGQQQQQQQQPQVEEKQYRYEDLKFD